jgi:pyrimidine oxygenase
MIKLRGFGEKSEFRDHNLASFTLMASLAAVTSRIKPFASVPTPRRAAGGRRAHVLDHRFDLEWAIWSQCDHRLAAARIFANGPVAGDDCFDHRYKCATEHIQILRALWQAGVSDLEGEFFTVNDCRLSPRPQADMKIICAGQSDTGMDFTAKYADYNFSFGKGLDTPTAWSDTFVSARPAARR